MTTKEQLETNADGVFAGATANFFKTFNVPKVGRAINKFIDISDNLCP